MHFQDLKISLEEVSSKRERGLKEHATHATHMKWVREARTVLTDMTRCCCIHSTLWGSLPKNPDVTILSPGLSPAVPDEPVVNNAGGAEVRAVSDQLDGVVQLDVLVVRAAGEHSTVVILEGVCSHRDGKRSNISKVGHDGILVIGRQVVVAGDGGNWVEGGKVVSAILIVCCCSRDIWVVSFRDLAKELDVVIGKGRGGTLATSVSTTVESVGCTGGDLLSRELDKASRSNGSVGLDLLGGAKGPAGPALALVLHSADHPLLPPVHLGWQVLHLVRSCLCLGVLGRSHFTISAQKGSLPFFLSEVRKLVDPSGIAAALRSIVTLNSCYIG